MHSAKPASHKVLYSQPDGKNQSGGTHEKRIPVRRIPGEMRFLPAYAINNGLHGNRKQQRKHQNLMKHLKNDSHPARNDDLKIIQTSDKQNI